VGLSQGSDVPAIRRDGIGRMRPRVRGYHDIRGDGGSEIVAQISAERERIGRALRGIRSRLAIASGKGGVGKSTLTLLLAEALRAEGLAVAIFDADWNGPCQARLSGLGARPLLPTEEGIELPRTRSGIGVLSMGTLVPEPAPVEFPSIAEGDSHVWRATREFTALGQLLGAVRWGELDLLLLDLPPGAERTFQFAEFLGPGTAFLLVTVPSDVSRGVVARAAASLAGLPNPVLGYVENMSGYWCEGCRERKPLFPESSAVELAVPCLGRLPFDPDLARRADAGEMALGDPSRPIFAEARALGRRVAELLELLP